MMGKFIMRRIPLSPLLERAKLLFSKLGQVFNSQDSRFPRVHKRLIAILFLVVAVLFLMPTASDTEQQVSTRKVISLTFTQPLNAANDNAVAVTASAIPLIAIIEPESLSGSWQHYIIKKGDSVYRIFRQYNVPATVLHKLIALDPGKQSITKINTGEKISFFISDTQQLIQLRISGEQRNHIYQLREDDSYIRNID